MSAHPTLGDAELQILNYIIDSAPVSVRVVADHFASEASLARTTILTVMERLRAKRLLTRRKVRGVYHYSPAVDKEQLMMRLIGDFVQKTLGGKISPFVAYLAQRGSLSQNEVAELKQLARDLRPKTTKGKK